MLKKGRWTYLAGVLDLVARRLVGWMSLTPDAALVSQALRRAVGTRQPEVRLLFSSDQRVQYRSLVFRHHLARGIIGQRMSGKGNCWVNDPIARLFWSLKTKWVSSGGSGIIKEGSQDMGANYIGYYNQERLHINNYLIPRDAGAALETT